MTTYRLGSSPMVYTPATIAVYCTVAPSKKNGLTEPDTHCIGRTNDPKQIAKMIAEDRAAMSNTFGGLIAPTPVTGRTYRAFRATWEEIKI